MCDSPDARWNVAGPQHTPADTLSSGRDSDWDLAEATGSDPGRVMSVSALVAKEKYLVLCCKVVGKLKAIKDFWTNKKSSDQLTSLPDLC